MSSFGLAQSDSYATFTADDNNNETPNTSSPAPDHIATDRTSEAQRSERVMQEPSVRSSSNASSHTTMTATDIAVSEAQVERNRSLIEETENIRAYIQSLRTQLDRAQKKQTTAEDVATEVAVDSANSHAREWIARKEAFGWRYLAEKERLQTDCAVELSQLFSRHVAVTAAKRRQFILSGEKDDLVAKVAQQEADQQFALSQLKKCETTVYTLKQQLATKQEELDDLQFGAGRDRMESQLAMARAQIPIRDAMITDLMERNQLLTSALATGDASALEQLAALEAAVATSPTSTSPPTTHSKGSHHIQPSSTQGHGLRYSLETPPNLNPRRSGSADMRRRRGAAARQRPQESHTNGAGGGEWWTEDASPHESLEGELLGAQQHELAASAPQHNANNGVPSHFLESMLGPREGAGKTNLKPKMAFLYDPPGPGRRSKDSF